MGPGVESTCPDGNGINQQSIPAPATGPEWGKKCSGGRGFGTCTNTGAVIFLVLVMFLSGIFL